MPDLLRSVWDEPRAANAPDRNWFDCALVSVFVVIAAVEGVLRHDMPLPVLQAVLTAALVPTLLWRRTRPLLAVAVAFGACGLVQAVTRGAVPQEYTLAFVLILPYALYRWGSGREAVLGTGVIVAKVAISWVVGNMTGAQSLEALGILFGAAALGVAFRYRGEARARELDRVKLLERERLARDLHDTVAHHVSAIAIRAQAGLAASASQPNAAVDALQLIEAEASRALGEMRAIVRLLRRNESAEAAQTPRISDIQALAARGRGPSVDVEIAGDVDGVSPAVGAAIYRLAQESITNARRHARHATHIKVRVDSDERSVHLSVSDDGETSATPARGSQGYGLVGMIERAGLLGGSFEAGPNPERGWTVRAVLPRTGSVA